MNDFTDLFASTEQSYGLPTGFLGRVAQIESSMNPRAQNPRSSAGGLFQFIDSTARQYGLQDRFDPAQATDAAARLARDNADRLRNALGRDPTAGELYLAHQQGGGGAARLLANPSARAADIVGARAVTLNGGTPDMTAGQFAQRWIGRVDGAAAPRQTAPQMLGYAATPRPSPAIAAIAQTTGGQPTAPQGQAMSDTAAAEKPAPSTIGGLGGLGGFQPIAGGKFGDMLQMIGMALLSSPGNAPLQNLPALQMAMAGRRDQAEERARQQANTDREFGLRQSEAARHERRDRITGARTEAETRRLQQQSEQDERDRRAWDTIFGGGPGPAAPVAPSPAPAPPGQAPNFLAPQPVAPQSTAPQAPQRRSLPDTFSGAGDPTYGAPPPAGATPAPAPAAPGPTTPGAPASGGGGPQNGAAAIIERIDRAIAAPGISPRMREGLLQYRRTLRPEVTPTTEEQDYRSYEQEERGAGRTPLSRFQWGQQRRSAPTQQMPKVITIKGPNGEEESVEQMPDGTYRRPTIQGAQSTPANPYATGRFNETQGKAAGFADRMMQAEGALQETEAAGYSTRERLAAAVPGIGNRLVSADFQRNEQAQRNFVNAILRRESGAAISPAEFDNARRQYFPQPGDSADVIAQKRQNRQAAIAAMAREGGPSYRPSYSFDQQGRISRVQQQASPLDAARDAISRGANPEAVRQRLRQNGIDPAGL